MMAVSQLMHEFAIYFEAEGKPNVRFREGVFIPDLSGDHVPPPKLQKDGPVIVLQVLRVPPLSIELDYCQCVNALCATLVQLYGKLLDTTGTVSEATMQVAQKADEALSKAFLRPATETLYAASNAALHREMGELKELSTGK